MSSEINYDVVKFGSVSAISTNVSVSVTAGFSKTNLSSSTTYGPAVIYIDQNYPNVLYPTSSSINSHSLLVNRSIYKGYGNKILFCIFPIKYTKNVGDIQNLLKYTTMSRDEIQNYATISFTPEGNFINSPIICDRIFHQNGLYIDDDNNKELGKKTKNYLSKNSSPLQYNWEIKQGYVSWSSNSSISSISKGTQNFGKVTEISYNLKKDNNKQPVFKYVDITNRIDLFGLQDKAKIGNGTVYREYHLDDWFIPHPQMSDSYSRNTTNETANNKSFAPTYYKIPFFFMIKLSKYSIGHVSLQFGRKNNKIKIDFYKNKNIIQVGKTASQIDLSYNVKNPPYLPYFMNNENFKDARTLIIYPTYLGIAVQPGIQLAGGLTVSDDKGNKIIRNLGAFIKYSGDPQSQKNIFRKFPSFQNWASFYKNIDPDGTDINKKTLPNIYCQPCQLHWIANSKDLQEGNREEILVEDKLKIKMYDATADLFFAPLHFLKYAKFRVYFQGIKSGKYQKDSFQPKKSGTAIASSSLQTYICNNTEPIIQYSYRTGTNQDSTESVPAIYHQYYASVLFSCQYNGLQDNTLQDSKPSNQQIISKFRSYITCYKKKAYRMPPVYIDDKAARKQFFQKYNMDTYYFQFEIDISNVVSGDRLPRLPVQIIGIMILQKVKQVKSLLNNGNGSFSFNTMNSSTLFNSSESIRGVLPIYSQTCANRTLDWYKCITNIQVSHNQQGSTGSITLDKYALMSQEVFPKQCIGGLQIKVSGGNQFVINPINTASNTSDYGSNDLLFTGYVSKITASDNISSDTISMTLQGIQKKLSQLKIINPPFWDGDQLTSMLNWVSFYSGIKVNADGFWGFNREYVFDKLMASDAKQYIDSNGLTQTLTKYDVPIAPVSSVFSRPAVNFKSGTDCFTIFKQICKLCNHRFVLQPNAEAYIFTQNKLALPLATEKGTTYSENYREIDISPDLIINFSFEPLLTNLYNFVLSASLLGLQQGAKNVGDVNLQSGFKLNKKAQQLIIDPNNDYQVFIPWSKVVAIKHEGFMSEKQLAKQHEINKYGCKNFWLNLKITIPGNVNIWIYDKVKIFNIQYYVTNVSHSVDLSSKKFTTELTLQSCVDHFD